MKPNSAARIAAVILAIAGLSAMLAAGLVATKQFTVTVSGRHFRCGSVILSRDPRNAVSRRATVPLANQQAARLCQRTNNSRTHTATTFLVAGVFPLLLVLMLPALSRRSRRSRAHRRVRL